MHVIYCHEFAKYDILSNFIYVIVSESNWLAEPPDVITHEWNLLFCSKILITCLVFIHKIKRASFAVDKRGRRFNATGIYVTTLLRRTGQYRDVIGQF